MLLIQNAYLINPADSREGICDIAIGNGRFLAIEASIPPERAAALAAGLPGDGEVRVIDARGLTAAPGLIDTHSHFRDPGFTRKEDLQTGAAAAARGGYTSVILMANVKPAVDCPDAVRDILERGRKTPVHMYTCANVTLGMQGRELADLKALAAEYRPGLYEDLRLMGEAISRRPMKAPTSDQVNLLNVLKLKKNVTTEELQRVAEAVKDCPVALSVVTDIARDHGIMRTFDHLSTEMSSQYAEGIVNNLKTGIEDFLANDTTRVSRMATAYHDSHFGSGEAMRTGLDPQPPTGLMKRRIFNDRESFYRNEIGLDHDTLQKFADIVDAETAV